MKIVRTSENQIKCTLDAEDLRLRSIDLSTLSYGSFEAKQLLGEMMDMAAREVGFVADDQPLVVEAVPLSPRELLVVITKVEYPEELDTRFSRFTPAGPEYSMDDEDYDEIVENAPAQRKPDLIAKLSDAAMEAAQEKNEEEDKVVGAAEGQDKIRIYTFTNMDRIIALSKVIPAKDMESSLYKNDKKGEYVLILQGNQLPTAQFRTICETVSEYGTKFKRGFDTVHFVEEHYSPVLREGALERLAGL